MNVIVLGTNHNNTLGLIWSLGEAGHNITLLLYSKGNNYVSKSKYISKTYLINRCDSIIERIKNVASRMDSKPVVLVSNDADASLLNNHYSELTQYCYIEGGKPDGSINNFRNKDVEEDLARECGFTVPKTVLIGSSDEIGSVSLDFPIIIKANNSNNGGKSAMKKCNNEQESKQFVQKLPISYYPLQVQQFIAKDYELMLQGCSLYGGKKVICPVANKKLRQFPKYTGLGSYSVSLEVRGNENLQQLAAKVAQYLQKIEYTGNFSAEFVYGNNKYYFLEINLRNDGTSWLSTCSGFNLPDMVCRSFVEDGISDENCTFHKMNYLNILADVNYWIDGTLTLRQWRKQFKIDTCYSHYNKNDRKPWRCYFKHPIIAIVKMVSKKLIHYR